MENEALGAVEHVARSVAARARRDIGEIVAGLPLGMGESELKIAAGDLRDQFGVQRVRSAEPQKSAGEHDGGEIRLQRQSAADLLHHDHGLDRPAGRAAVLFGERQAEEAELGVARP